MKRNFVNLYHMDLDLKLKTQSVIIHSKVYNYQNKFGIPQEKFRHKRSQYLQLKKYQCLKKLRSKKICKHTSMDSIATPLVLDS